ncbi:helix-turn-helix domain-containing protein [Haladaptatus salinisoli]|uniref:helix-turn-helix domain-containing protein n=1 Tax=Haladaptatus salinisoli TaxID=2884876 RepID=UPI001D0BC67B|nr:helix-turn-helix domain-containing protein [Haladaptatus salinisoli]
MSVVATFRLETPILRRALRDVPDLTASVVQQTETPSTATTMTFRTSGDDFAAFEAGLDADQTVADWTVLAEIDGVNLYRVALSERGEEHVTYRNWAELGAVFMSAERSGDGWHVQMRFPNRESVQEYAAFCRERDLTFDLSCLYGADGERGDGYGLTAVQRETLLAAIDAGYYSIPRETSAEELAERLGVSHQAVSERLRRGTETLIRSTVGEPTDAREGARRED